MTSPEWKVEVGVSPIVEENIQTLAQLMAFLEELDGSLYQKLSGNQGQHSIGKHVRHVIDHYLTFLGLADNAETLDYEHRQRDGLLETDRQTAIHCLVGVIQELSRIPPDETVNPLTLGHHSEGHDQLFSSSIGRELVFLASHTVHHMAIIGLLAEQAGKRVEDGFGVNPSTLRHWAHQDKQKQAVNKVVACNNGGTRVSV